jgi:hypothetical protein
MATGKKVTQLTELSTFSGDDKLIIVDTVSGTTKSAKYMVMKDDLLNSGPIEFEADSGAVTAMNMPVTSEASSSAIMSLGFAIDSNQLLTVSALHDGVGGINSGSVIVSAENYSVPQTQSGSFSA